MEFGSTWMEYLNIRTPILWVTNLENGRYDESVGHSHPVILLIFSVCGLMPDVTCLVLIIFTLCRVSCVQYYP